MVSLCCMSFLGKDTPEILVAGCQGTMYKIDVEKGFITEQVRDASLLMRYHLVCA